MRRRVLEGELGRELAVYCPWEVNSMHALAYVSSGFLYSSYRSEPGLWDRELHLVCFAETRRSSCARGEVRSSSVCFKRFGDMMVDVHQPFS